MVKSDRDIETWDKRLTEQNTRGWENYLRRRIYLDELEELVGWNICGEFLCVEKVSDVAVTAEIRLNRNTNDPIDLEVGTVIKTIFCNVYISHAAQQGEWIDLIWGINFEYYKEHPTVISDGGGSITIDGTVTIQEPLSINGAVIIQEPLSINDGGGSLTVDGTFWQGTQPVSAAALPLPAGAATLANQLVDGHNVTVDNAGGGAAVNIQDGGNSITVDGTVTVVDNGIARPCIIITNVAADANTVGAAHACKRVLVRAHTTNTGLVWVDFGAAAVDVSCYPLDKGDAYAGPLLNTNQVNCLFKVANEKVTVVYTN